MKQKQSVQFSLDSLSFCLPSTYVWVYICFYTCSYLIVLHTNVLTHHDNNSSNNNNQYTLYTDTRNHVKWFLFGNLANNHVLWKPIPCHSLALSAADGLIVSTHNLIIVWCSPCTASGHLRHSLGICDDVVASHPLGIGVNQIRKNSKTQ